MLLLGSLTGALLGWLMGFLSLFLILLILIQRGKGGGLTGALGGPGGQSAFGSKAGDTFTVITIVVASLWGLTCILTMLILGTDPNPPVVANEPNISAGPGEEEDLPRNDLIIPPSGGLGSGFGADSSASPEAGETPSMDLTPADGDLPPSDASPSDASPSDASPTTDSEATPDSSSEEAGLSSEASGASSEASGTDSDDN
jgi:preprotein translocase subunit SecG